MIDGSGGAGSRPGHTYRPVRQNSSACPVASPTWKKDRLIISVSQPLQAAGACGGKTFLLNGQQFFRIGISTVFSNNSAFLCW